MIGESGDTLRNIGRLSDAIEPARVSAEAYAKSASWQNAGIAYSSFSLLHLATGNLPASVAAARQALDFADRSGNVFQRLTKRVGLADALHQSGDLAEAARLFAEAERLQAERQPEWPILYSLQGYRYCDLLLGQGQSAEVLRRASQTLRWSGDHRILLDIGLDHLSLSRAHPSGSPEAAHHLERAVDFLRRAGRLDMLPLALLARGTDHDLDEVFRIATRSGMRLHLADYHLAKGNLAEAERLINETGYHRRDPELAALRAKKANP